jgi:membrane fusion protein, hemolysin D
MDIDNKRVNLSAGIAVTVEIKNGSRSIISYLLSPLLRYKQESMRERWARSETSAVKRPASR